MYNNSKAQQSNNKFNVKEYTLNGVTDRKHFSKLNELPEVTGKKDIYVSHYDHSDDIIQYVKENDGELIGYNGAVGISTIVLDIDHENHLDEALEIGRKFLRHLEAKYELDLNTISINFSGNKGFHFRLPAELFGGFEPSEELPATIKSIAKKLTDGFDHFDNGIYDKTRIIRVLNTVNGKSARYAIPLTSNEFFTLTIDEIIALASSAREVETLDADEIIPNAALTELKKLDLTSSSASSTDVIENDETVKELLKGGITSGNRHDAMLRIVSYLIHFGVPDNTIIELLKHWNTSNNPPKAESDLVTEVKGVIKKYEDLRGDFWTIKRNKSGRTEIQLKHSKLLSMLEEQGYGKIYLKKSYVFIKENNKRIVEVMQEQMRDGILEYVKAFPSKQLPEKNKNDILDYIIAKNSSVMGDGVLALIKTNELNLIKDTMNTGFMLFDNAIVEITKEGMQLKTYDEMNRLTWNDQINPRNISIIDEYKCEEDESDFGRFVWNISGKNFERFYSIVSGIGYLLHSYKDSSRAKAIVFCDEKISDDPNGRTGKSLISKAISKVKESVRMDGKSVNFKDRFVYQQLELSTQIMEFNDVRRNFDFESLFSTITDAINVEKKNGHKFSILFEDAPKILISTNFTIKGTGDSYTDRLFEVEFSDYYNAQHKPIDDFGKRFFEEWDEVEWCKFDNFMMLCEQFYLEHGLVEYEKINLNTRKLMDNTSPEFISFVETVLQNIFYDKNEIYSKFISFYPDFEHIKQRTFTQWLKIYSDKKGYVFETKKSNGKDKFMFKSKNVNSLFN